MATQAGPSAEGFTLTTTGPLGPLKGHGLRLDDASIAFWLPHPLEGRRQHRVRAWIPGRGPTPLWVTPLEAEQGVGPKGRAGWVHRGPYRLADGQDCQSWADFVESCSLGTGISAKASRKALRAALRRTLPPRPLVRIGDDARSVHVRFQTTASALRGLRFEGSGLHVLLPPRPELPTDRSLRLLLTLPDAAVLELVAWHSASSSRATVLRVRFLSAAERAALAALSEVQ